MNNNGKSADEAMVFKIKADFLKALAHPARLAIIEYLKRGEASVGQMVKDLGLEQSGLSKHLAGPSPVWNPGVSPGEGQRVLLDQGPGHLLGPQADRRDAAQEAERERGSPGPARPHLKFFWPTYESKSI